MTIILNRAAFLALSLLAAGTRPAAAGCVQLSSTAALAIGMKIYQNEAGQKARFLTHWNEGEEFPSMGIGHFIWYPEGYMGPFEESFPKLVKHLRKNGAALPAWLRKSPHCPWKTREDFYKDFDGPRLTELRVLLESTIPLQAEFAAKRLKDSLPKLLKALPRAERTHVKKQFDRVANQPLGLYPLVDYVNFKGEGVKDSERYAGKGWGLLQVLQGMSGTAEDGSAAVEFAASAERALEERVKNSPPERNEARWLAAWKKRLKTYVEP
ncbi:MAG: hypothetical protein HYZ75_00210 [Elusimicrobia bacterium]|nr:hypothetical protein [Elusimicrobiota bacterium]